MMAARQAASAQLEQFRAEMVAEAAKMRAAVERQVLFLHHLFCDLWSNSLPCDLVKMQHTMQNATRACVHPVTCHSYDTMVST